MSDAPEISVVIPCLNEADNAAGIAAAVKSELVRSATSHEIIFIDNGSTDGTVDLIKALCANDPSIRLIVNNQNYGQMRSPTHAIYQATGQAVIAMCADFQDPPELISPFIDLWRRGRPIVLGVRQSEQSPLFNRILRRAGYAFFSTFGDYKVIPDATGFGIYSREVVDCLRRWRDPEPFFRGMLVESGYDITTIAYERPARLRGTTKNNLSTLVSFAVSGIASSSKRLLRAPMYIAFAGFILIIPLLLIAFVFPGALWRGFAVALLDLLFSMTFLFMGLIGEQLRIVAEIVRNTPLVVEKERVNFPPAI